MLKNLDASTLLDPYASLTSVAEHEGTWLAVGSDGTILRSTDRKEWITIAERRVRGGARIKWSRVSYAGSQWIVVGAEDCCSALMARSVDDGLTWEDIDLRQQDVGELLDFASRDSIILAVGRPREKESRMILGLNRIPSFNVLASTDGVQWHALRTGVQHAIEAIANVDGRWFVGTDRGRAIELRIDLPHKIDSLRIERSRPGYVIVSVIREDFNSLSATRDLRQPFRVVSEFSARGEDRVLFEIPTSGAMQFFQSAD